MSIHRVKHHSLLRGRAFGTIAWLTILSSAVLIPGPITAATNQIIPLSVSAQLGAGAHAEFPQEGNRHVSDDGRFVAFASFATNLVPGQVDTNSRRDIFLYDRELDSMQLVSHSTAGQTTAGNSGCEIGALVSGDGAFVLFISESTNLISGVTEGNSSWDVFLWERASGDITLVSHAAGSPTQTGNAFSSLNAISDDGAWVVFQTTATDMVAGVTTNIYVDVFLWERATGDITLVSHTSASSSTEGNFWSYGAQISGDGAWITFVSGSTDLISGTDPNSTIDDVFLFERATGTISLVSHVDGDPTTTGSTWSNDPSISNDGAWIAFRSRAANLVPTDTNNSEDIFLFERASGLNSLVSHAGADSGNGSSSEPQLSGDGGWVAFTSAATDLVGGIDSNGQTDTFLYERTSGIVTLVSHASGSTTTAGDNRSSNPTVADGGAWVGYLSRSTDLVPATDDNGGSDIFLFDRSTGTNRLVSHTSSSSTAAGNDISDAPALAPGGAIMFFRSKARDLVDGVSYGSSNFAFVHDRASDENFAVSRADFGFLPFTANDASKFTSISDDGRFTVFLSEALDLVPGQQDDPDTEDVFLYDSLTGRVTLVSHVPGSSVRTGQQDGNHDDLDPPLISGDGNYVVFQSFAPDLVGGSDTNDDQDLFLWSRATGTLQLISHTSGSSVNAANNVARNASISTDGAWVAFETRASDLGFTDNNFTYDVFVWERATGNHTLVSRTAANPSTTGDGISQDANINGDGTAVGFASYAQDLVTGLIDSNISNDVYVWSRGSGAVQLVSHVPGFPNQTPSDLGSGSILLSRDGAYAVFSSPSDELVTGTDTNSATDIFLWNSATGVVTLVSHVAGLPTTAGDSWCDSQGISDDGAYVAFRSRSTDLQAGVTDTNNEYDVFQWHRASDTTTLVSHIPGDALTTANSVSSEPSMSGDGAWIAFSSHATNLIGSDTNSSTDSFRWDRAANEVSLLSHQLGDPTTTAAGASFSPAMSHSGAFVSFTSRATNLVANDFDTTNDVFLFGDDLDTDLAVTMSAHPDPVGLGWEVTWTIDVTNNGPGAAARVLVSDPLPPGVTFTGAGGLDWTCDVQESTATCLLLGLKAGFAAPSLEISGLVPETGGLVENTVTVISSSEDHTAANDSDNTSSNVQILPPQVVDVAGEPTAGSLEDCQSTSDGLNGLTLTFSQTMSNPPGHGTGSSDDLTDPDNYFLVSAGADRDLDTTTCGVAGGDDVVIAISQVTANGASTEALLEPETGLGTGLYRVFACASLADDGGQGLDGNGDGISGEDFSQQFRVDLGNLLSNGSFDCDLDAWSQVEEDPAELTHDSSDVDNASASGSARAFNLVASELGLYQCLQTNLPTIEIQAQVRVEDATDLVGRLECAGYDQSNCTGLVLDEDGTDTALSQNPGVWDSFEALVAVPTGASVMCGVALQTPGGLPFEAFLDDLRAQDSPLFADGFESGDTSSWSSSRP